MPTRWKTTLLGTLAAGGLLVVGAAALPALARTDPGVPTPGSPMQPMIGRHDPGTMHSQLPQELRAQMDAMHAQMSPELLAEMEHLHADMLGMHRMMSGSNMEAMHASGMGGLMGDMPMDPASHQEHHVPRLPLDRDGA